MKNSARRALVVVGCTLACLPAFAYKQATHEQMSKLAVSASVLSSQDALDQLGLRYGVDDENQKFAVTTPKGVVQLKVIEAIRFGANFEDTGNRAVHHFFNPRTNTPLMIFSFTLLNDTSPDWALEDNGTISSFHVEAPQKYSYRLAKDYFLNALIKPTKTERDKNWGLAFQTLGQVIHHVQDMAQPQHVRNDIHLDLSGWGLPTPPLATSPSTYERWILKSKDDAAMSGYLVAFSCKRRGVCPSCNTRRTCEKGGISILG